MFSHLQVSAELLVAASEPLRNAVDRRLQGCKIEFYAIFTLLPVSQFKSMGVYQ